MDMENDMKTPRPQPNPDPVPGSSANVLDLCCPCSSDIDIGHIAHHLALLNQFGGFTQRPYSFAEHALLATEIAERAFGLTHPATLMACLLRDAHAAMHRAKLQGPGEGFRDSAIAEESARGLRGLVNLIGIDSPGLTSSPAIAEEVEHLLTSTPRT